MPCSLLFQEGQDVHGELSSEVNPAMLRITNIQKLQVQYCAFIRNQLASSSVNCLRVWFDQKVHAPSISTAKFDADFEVLCNS